MACHLCDTEPFSEPVVVCCQFQPLQKKNCDGDGPKVFKNLVLIVVNYLQILLPVWLAYALPFHLWHNL